MEKRLNGEVAVVTGAAGILCSIFSEALLEEGASVALLDIDGERAEKLAAELAEKGYSDTLPIGADVLDRASIENARRSVMEKWGKIDILLNGAGGNSPKGTCPLEQLAPGDDPKDSFFGLDIAGFKQINELNFIGTLIPTQVFCEAMLENGGSVVNISSMSSTQPMTRVPAYSAAKAAIDNFTRWLAVHLAPSDIRVNAIAPGFFSTEQNRFLLFEKDGKTLTQRGSKIINNTPMRRFGKPEELLGALKFLCSNEDASFVTGVVIPVDGGFMAYSGV
jgi:NAD(P)-dependent dehydrogenase (short-subunit alcohol dehydrogenase family)